MWNFKGVEGLQLRKWTCHCRPQMCLRGPGSKAREFGRERGPHYPQKNFLWLLSCCLSTKRDQNTAHKLLWSNQGALKEIRLGLKALGLWVNKNFDKNGKYSPGPWYNISLGCWYSISQSYNLSDVCKVERVSKNCVGQRKFQKHNLQKDHQFFEWPSRDLRHTGKWSLFRKLRHQ